MGCGSSVLTNSPGSIDRSMVEQVVRQVALEYLSRKSGSPGPAPTLTELTVYKDLYQAGNFAANEKVTIIGPRSRLISNLRILGPMRKQSQIELAFTDAISLGFDNIPVRLSGNLAGSPGAIIMGPKGTIQLKEGIIRAAIHVHMNPAEAGYFGVKQGDMMKLRVGGEAGVTFNKVHVRIDPTSRLNVHMDTDEANACGLHLTKDIELLK
jgi:putative phosphotransacetylase